MQNKGDRVRGEAEEVRNLAITESYGAKRSNFFPLVLVAHHEESNEFREAFDVARATVCRWSELRLVTFSF